MCLLLRAKALVRWQSYETAIHLGHKNGHRNGYGLLPPVPINRPNQGEGCQPGQQQNPPYCPLVSAPNADSQRGMESEPREL